MKDGYLDGKLECKACGTMVMAIPRDAGEFTPIPCSNCGAILGTWGELQDEFARQATSGGVLELSDRKIRQTRAGRRPHRTKKSGNPTPDGR